MDSLTTKSMKNKNRVTKRIITDDMKQPGPEDSVVQIRISVPSSMLKRLLNMKKGESILHEHEIVRFAVSEILRKAGY